MAEQFGIRLSVNVTDLRASINEAIDKINSSGSLHKVKISADTSEISKEIKNLKTELQAITKKSVTPKIALGTSRADGQVTLAELDAYKKSQKELANSKGLTAVQTDLKKTITVVKALTAAVKDFKKELNNIEIGNIKTLNEQFSQLNQNITGKNTTQKTTKNVKSSTKNSVTDKLKEQQQLQNDVAKTVQTTNQKEISSEIAKMQAYEKTNALMEQRVKLVRTLGGGYNKYESQKMGNAVESQTITTLNGEVHTISSVANYEKQRKEIEKNYAAAGKLASKLEDIKVKYSDVNGTKPITNTNNLDDLNAKYSSVKNKITELSQASAESSTYIKADIEKQISELDRLVKQYQNVEYAATSLRTKNIPTIKEEQTNEIDKFTQNILRSSVPLDTLKDKIDTLKISLANVTDKDTLVKFLNDFDILNSEFDALNSKAKATSDIAKQIDRNITGLNRIANNTVLYRNKNINTKEYESLIGAVDTLKKKYLELQASLKTDGSSENLNNVKTKLVELEDELKKTGVRAASLKKEFSTIRIDGANSKKIAQTLGVISETVRLNALAMGKIDTLSGKNLTFGEEFEQLKYQLQKSPELVDQVNNKVRVLQANIKTLGFEGNTILGDFREKALKFIKWTGMTLLVTKVRMYIRKMFTTVYELDTALIDLRKTFEGTNEELENFYFEANNLAKQMGVATEEIISQASAWARLGYNTSEASKKMSEMSSMFAAISPDMNVEQATDGLVSIMKAFNITPNDVLDGILSKINTIGNTASTSNGEIVEMLKRSSSAMKAANNTLEETIALETAAIEIVRDAPSVGTAFKTISQKLRGYSEETEDFTEDVEVLSGKIADLTKTAKTPGGISLFSDANKQTYKSTYQILKEISEIWNTLTDKSQAELLEVIAGKRQSQIVAATLDNFKAAEKAMTNMENSAGSAEAEMEVIRDSAEYAFNALKETFTSLAQHSIDRGGLKALIKGATALLDIVDKIVSKIGFIPTIITTITGVMTAKRLNGNNGIFSRNSDNKFEIFGSQVNGGFKSWLAGLGKTNPEIKAQQRELQNATAAINQYHKAYKSKTMTEEIGNNVLNNSNKIVRDYGNAIRNGASESNAYTAAQKRLNAELKNVGKNAKAAGEGSKIAAAGLKVLNTAASMLISMGISAVISLVIKVIEDSINSVQNHIDKLSELTDKEKSLKSEIEKLNKELSETKIKIDELEKKPKLTILEKGELQNLKEANDELERQIRLQKSDLAGAISQKNKEAEELYEEIIGTKKWEWYNWLAPITGIASSISNMSNGNFLSQQLNDFDNYKKKLKEIEELRNSVAYKNGSPETREKEESLKKEINDLFDITQKNYNDKWAKIANGLNPDIKKNQKIIKFFDDLMNEWDELNKKASESFFDVYNDPQFATVKKYLEDLAKQGKLTEDVFNSLTEEQVKGIDKFREALKSIPDADTKSVIEAIIEAVKNAGDEAENASKKIKTFAEALDTLKDKIDDIVTKQGKLAEAFKKTGLGGTLSAEEVFSLVKEIPQIAKYVEKVGKEFTISSEGFSQANNALYQKMQSQINALENEKNKQIILLKNIKKLCEDDTKQDEYKDLISQYNKDYDFLNEENLDKKIDDIIKSVEGEKTGYLVLRQLMVDSFDEQKAVLDAIDEGIDTVKKKVSTFNNEIKTIDSAIKNLNDGTLLSYDEMNAIVDLAPELQDFFVKQENGYSIIVDKLENLRRKSYETRNDYIKDVRSRVEADMKAAKTEKELIEQQIENLKKAGINGATSAMRFVELTKSLADMSSQTESLAKILEKLDGLAQDITYDAEKDKSNISDELQWQIDYYSTILSAIEIVKDKHIEVIDKEIDALNDSKDALKDANDERQRELDLIDARNNLENAKKRKVWVYTEGRGFQQVQDKKAIKEAEEKYRDAIQNSQEAAIDKQISEKEKEKEALENLTKGITDLNETINNAITVSEALKSLGITDEKDLLNLPDNVKSDIKNGLADARVNKSNEDNKENPKYTPVTLDDVLSNLGAKVTAADIDRLGLATKNDFDSAVKSFADSLKAYQEANVSNVTNNNSGTVISPTFNISGVTDPEEVAKVVNSEMTNLFTKLNNSIK